MTSLFQEKQLSHKDKMYLLLQRVCIDGLITEKIVTFLSLMLCFPR